MADDHLLRLDRLHPAPVTAGRPLDQQVTLAALGMTVEFHRGETLLTEISSELAPQQFAGEISEAGFVTLDRWTAEPGYQLVLAGPADAPC